MATPAVSSVMPTVKLAAISAPAATTIVEMLRGDDKNLGSFLCSFASTSMSATVKDGRSTVPKEHTRAFPSVTVPGRVDRPGLCDWSSLERVWGRSRVTTAVALTTVAVVTGVLRTL